MIKSCFCVWHKILTVESSCFFAGPHTLASCGNLTLTGSQSFGGGGRPLIYEWELTSPDSGQDITDIRDVLSGLSSDAVRVKLSGTMFETGKAYEFKLKVANFLNQSSFEEVTHSITKAAEPVPALTLSSGIDLNEGEVFVSEELSIKATAIVSKTLTYRGPFVSSFSIQYKCSSEYRFTSSFHDLYAT